MHKRQIAHFSLRITLTDHGSRLQASDRSSAISSRLQKMLYELLESRRTDEISAFLSVTAEGSFVAAGRSLKRHPTVISKRVAAMEQRLGVRLVERSTRQLRVTEAGLQLANRLTEAFTLAAVAEHQAAALANEVRGHLRLALPGALGRLWIAPLLPEFLRKHPEVTVTADYSERFVDLIGENFDAAIRVGELLDSRLIAKKLCAHRRILCASPSYLREHGAPNTPAELSKHNFLRFTQIETFPTLRLTDGNSHQAVAVQGTLSSNDSETLLAAAIAGIGILAAGEWLMNRELSAGTLLPVLPSWSLDAPGNVYFVRPSAKFTSGPVSAFKAWIESKFSEGPIWVNAKI